MSEEQIEFEKPVSPRTPKAALSGNLRIGDQWNAITIIALSQSNPLKAIAELVENSIDAKARNITIIRGKERGEHYLRLVDDGLGIPKDGDGIPDFKYVATHVCDSLKKKMKTQGLKGIQGEFGIGLLSFWTVGETLTMRCHDLAGHCHQMTMTKGNPAYQIIRRKTISPEPGTEIVISPLLPGIRGISGEKLQWYLASELRNRILEAGVQIRIVDRAMRLDLMVEPKKFTGRRLSEIKPHESPLGTSQIDIYLDDSNSENRIALYRLGTRVLESISELDEFKTSPWTSGYFQGYIDIPFLNLTPGSRLGIIRDENFQEGVKILTDVGESLQQVLTLQKEAEEQRASRVTLSSLHKAFHEALLALPPEEYDWFDIHKKTVIRAASASSSGANGAGAPDPLGTEAQSIEDGTSGFTEKPQAQRQFFEYPGPLYKVLLSPRNTLIPVGGRRKFIAVPQDRKRQRVEERLSFRWSIVEGAGALTESNSEVAEFTAASEPGLVRIKVIVTQGDLSVEGEALITVTDSLPESSQRGDSGITSKPSQGLPTYTFQSAPGELWRSQFDEGRNLVVINNGHKDFVYSSRTNAQKLRYLCRLYSKELILKNFPGCSASEAAERMIEISLYAEDNLK